ncbi:MAG: dienelactone hydrolase family protein [Pirellulaceae bacterium]|nr:dienelactone hydrolase family protein [Pirellulaceae bacterium]
MNIPRRFAICTALLVLLTPAIAAVAEEIEKAKTGTHGTFINEKLTVNKQERLYRLMVPKLLDLKKPAALVVAFHGMGVDSSKVMPHYTRLDSLAAEEKFILVYPEAVGRSWGVDPKKVTADLAFFDALIADISSRYEVDANRIYVLGMSNGGYFAHLVGKERSTKVAAVCSHSGPLGLQTILGINAERKFPVMIVHGDKDFLFNVKIARDNRDKYQREKHEVQYVEVAGLNHFWAGVAKINSQIWEFFEKHPLK